MKAAKPLMAFPPAILCLSIGLPNHALSFTRMFLNTNPDLMIVGRNEDHVIASHLWIVATPRGIRCSGGVKEADPRS